MSLPTYFSFWGKARPVDGASSAFHPLVYHMLDVAAVADAILEARPQILRRGATLTGLGQDDTRSLLITFAAVHDVGKFSQHFQGMVPELWPVVLGNRDTTRFVRSHHSQDGYILWTRCLRSMVASLVWPNGPEALAALGRAAFGHHGRPVRTEVGSRPLPDYFSDPAKTAAIDCAQALCGVLCPQPIDAPDLDESVGNALGWWAAGLITVADWAASRQEWFTYHASPSEGEELTLLAEYWSRTRKLADKAVCEAGLRSPTPASLRSFAELTGRPEPPTPAQTWATTVPLPNGPVLAIIEDATGSGKTEAAQMLVHRLMADGRAAGAYWAMPTQATANAMYKRQGEVVRRLFDSGESLPSLILAHAQASLHEGFASTVLRSTGARESAPAETGDDAGEPGSVACAAFLADDRRAAFLADVGAGTVDQAMFGVLPAKFGTVRLFGLAAKVLVIDEAHAYDAYMREELYAMLRFQAALGGCAIVLSATLTQDQRRALVRAWHEGLGVSAWHQSANVITRAEYPLATLVAAPPHVSEHPLDAAAMSRRRMGIRFIHSADEAVTEIVRAATAGAAVAWVRNTVDSCIDAAERLGTSGVPATVFHARFAQSDRQSREREILDVFGPPDRPNYKPEQRRGCVVVATQVIEQSLDLDFDLLITDLAPIDLVLQRAGRAWRHALHPRPQGLAKEIVILAPPFAEDPTADWLNDLMPGTRCVYENPAILWRSLRALHKLQEFSSPDDIRSLVEAVYAKAGDVPANLESKAAQAEGKSRADQTMGKYATLSPSEPYDGGAQVWLDDAKARTRLDADRRPLRLGRVVSGRLEPWAQVAPGDPAWKPWALSEVPLSFRQLPPGTREPDAFAAAAANARKSWGRFEQDIPILPLIETGTGEWSGAVTDGSARERPLAYSRALGLRFSQKA